MKKGRKSAKEMAVESELGQQILDLVAGVPAQIGMEALFRAFVTVSVCAVDEPEDLGEIASNLQASFMIVAADQWDYVRRQLVLPDAMETRQ